MPTAIPLVLGVVSFATQAFGAYAQYRNQRSQGEIQSIQYNSEADTAAANAELEMSNARIAESDAAIRQAEAYVQSYKLAGNQRSVLAQNGIIGSRTGMSILNELDSNINKEQDKIYNEGQLNAAQSRINAYNYLGQEASARGASRVAIAGSKNKTGLYTGILGGAVSGLGAYVGAGGGFGGATKVGGKPPVGGVTGKSSGSFTPNFPF